ncbi:MAG: TolC family protein [Planctomycetes bacterium]|nr:TolC family protein [Planctomycetota bacterium]
MTRPWLACACALLLAACGGRSRPEPFAPWPGDPAPAPAAVASASAAAPVTGSFLIDLPTTLRLAETGPLQVALVEARLARAEAEWLEAAQRLLPSLLVGGSYWRLDGLDQDNQGQFLDVGGRDWLHFPAQVVAELRPGDALFASLAAAGRRDAAQAGAASARRQVTLEAAERFFELQEAEAQAAALRRAVTIAERLAGAIETAARVGRAFEGDVLRARARANRARLEAEGADGRRRVASARLATLLRLDPRVDLHAPPEPLPVTLVSPDTALEALVTDALSRRPELQVAEATLVAAEREEARALWGPFVPAVRGLASFGQFGDPGRDLETRKEFALGVWWTIGPGGLLDLGWQRRVAADLRAAELSRLGAYEAVVGEVVAAHAEAGARRAQLDLARLQVDEAGRALGLHEARDRLGVTVPLELIEAERAATQAWLDLIAAASGYNRAQYRLWFAAGAGERP